MQTDTIKLIVTYSVAALLAIGGTLLAYVAWSQPVDPARDISILYGILGLVIGSAVTFLFGAESSTRATRAAQSSAASGAATATGVTPAPPNPPTTDS